MPPPIRTSSLEHELEVAASLELELAGGARPAAVQADGPDLAGSCGSRSRRTLEPRTVRGRGRRANN